MRYLISILLLGSLWGCGTMSREEAMYYMHAGKALQQAGASFDQTVNRPTQMQPTNCTVMDLGVYGKQMRCF